ncbi:MAG: S9 family peptidase [Asticcacaulis sp.]
MLAGNALAQTAPATVAAKIAIGAPLTPERVFADPDISGPKAVGVKLSPDGQLLTFLKPKAENGQVQDLWAVAVKGGEPYLLIDSATLTTPSKALSEAEKSRRERMRVSARGIVAYDWSEDSRFILVPVDGDIYLYDLATKAVKRVTDTPGDEVDAKLSPKGGSVAYVRDATLWLRDLASGAETQLSPKGEGTTSYATAEFIAQEELGRFTGYWWSPDAARIAYQKTDESGVKVAQRVEIGGEGVNIVQQRYPFAGTPNAVVELYVKTLGGADVKVDLGANPDVYIGRVNWSKDGKALYVQRLSRDQHRLDLLKVDPATGASTIILTETSDTWVLLRDDFRLLSDGGFIWASERDGYNHLYLYGADGKLVRQITHGDWPVDHLSDLNEKTGELWFEASKDEPLERRLYKVNYKTPAEPVALTSGGGWWSAEVSGGGTAFIGSYSDPVTPPQTALYDGTGKRLRWIEENRLDAAHPWFPYKDEYPAPEFGTLKAADGQLVYYSMLKPKGFDPAKKYPVVVSIYGGPHVTPTVRKSWVSPSNRLFQQAGFIVFTLDNRGTSNRSMKFQSATYKHLGGVDIDDQIMGAHWLQRQSYVDPAHIGIMGWSYGGFTTMMAMTAKDTPFAAGAAGAPPTQWALYDTAYTERYMSTPQANPEGYAASDVLNRIDNLKPGSLLLMQGMADDNVQFSNSTRVMLALQKKSVPFELMLYPGERHGLHGNERNLQRYRLYLDFFGRKLKPAG